MGLSLRSPPMQRSRSTSAAKSRPACARSSCCTRITAGVEFPRARLGGNAMKIVVYGPERRTGALRDGMIVDLCGAYAKYAWEKDGDPRAVALAEALVPADLARFIDGGSRPLDSVQKAVEYLIHEAQDQRDRRGAMLVPPVSETRNGAAPVALDLRLMDQVFNRLLDTVEGA